MNPEDVARLVAEKRDAKASKVVLWLEHANGPQRRCRTCWERIERDGDGRWVSKTSFNIVHTTCQAPGFKAAGAHVPHRPETWTPERVERASVQERIRISQLAGLTKPCSEKTWERVVALYKARIEHLHGGAGS